jgi:hypothetical protein
LIPKGVAIAVKASTMKFKILLLNNSHDRETTGFTSATDYVHAIVQACQDSLPASLPLSYFPWNEFLTHVIYLRGSEIKVDILELRSKGIECVGIWPMEGKMVYDASVLERVLAGICSGKGAGLKRRATIQSLPSS